MFVLSTLKVAVQGILAILYSDLRLNTKTCDEINPQMPFCWWWKLPEILMIFHFAYYWFRFDNRLDPP